MPDPEDDKKQDDAASNEPESEGESASDGDATADGESAKGGRDWRAQLEAHLADAKELGKDIRGRLADASKRASEEAKQTWSKLEPQIDTAEKTLREATDDAVESLKGMFGELKGSLNKLRDKI